MMAIKRSATIMIEIPSQIDFISQKKTETTLDSIAVPPIAIQRTFEIVWTIDSIMLALGAVGFWFVPNL